MAKPSYFELLKDPRWQRRRLEALSRADFQCENCEANDKTLHVHHKLYRKGAKPWEYEDHELQALCEDCHAAEHAIRSALADAMAMMAAYELDRLLGYAQGMMLFAGELDPVKVRNYEHASGLSDAVSAIDTEDLYHFVPEKNPANPLSGRDISELYTFRRDRRNPQ